jgi:hypothetical protein
VNRSAVSSCLFYRTRFAGSSGTKALVSTNADEGDDGADYHDDAKDNAKDQSFGYPAKGMDHIVISKLCLFEKGVSETHSLLPISVWVSYPIEVVSFN